MAKQVRVDPATVRSVTLRALAAGVDLDDLQLELFAFQRDHDHTMAEVLLELAADVVIVSEATRGEPIDYADLLTTHLSEYEYKGKVDHRSIHYVLTYPAARAGGLQPDFLGDISWWRTQLWPYALQALVPYMRAAAERTNQTPQELAGHLALQHHIDV